jgi:hypothetical protein
VFSVIFEVHPKPDKWDAYLDNAKMLRPEHRHAERPARSLNGKAALGTLPHT